MNTQVTKAKDGWTTVITNEITARLNQMTAEERANVAPFLVSARQQKNYLDWDYSDLVYNLIFSRGSFLNSSAHDMHDQIMSDLLGYTSLVKETAERSKSVVDNYFDNIENARASFLSFFRTAAANRLTANIQRGRVPIIGISTHYSGGWELNSVVSMNAEQADGKSTVGDYIPSTTDVEKEVETKFTFVKPIRDLHNKYLMNGKKETGPNQTMQFILADILKHSFIEHLDSLSANAILSKKYDIPASSINEMRRTLVKDLRKVLSK